MNLKLSDIELPSNRKFGLFFAVIFGLAFAYFFYIDIKTAYWAFAVLSLTFVILTFINPDLLTPLNKIWMSFGLLIGMIIGPIVISIMFIGIFTPIGLLMKLFGRDELRLKLIDRKSYWKIRDPSGTTSDSFKQQF